MFMLSQKWMLYCDIKLIVEKVKLNKVMVSFFECKNIIFQTPGLLGY